MPNDSFNGAGLLLLLVSIHTVPEADEFDQFLKPFFTKNCVKCHGGEKVKGKVNLKEIANIKQFLANPELIKELIEVIDAADMPPEDEPRLTEAQRANLLATLKTELRAATATAQGRAHTDPPPEPVSSTTMPCATSSN